MHYALHCGVTMEQIQIFDTTLRDGEQSPGASMTVEQKFEIALQLKELQVDIIETGFPISSQHQYDACKKIAEEIHGITQTTLARTVSADIDAAAEALKKASNPRIHTFISTSPIHMQYKLRKKPEEVLEAIEHAVRYARNKVAEVEFSPEDATRTEPDFLCKAVDIAIQSGAQIINIPDTVGYTIPQEYYDTIMMLKNRVPNIDKVILSAHCHNDLGLAVANTLSSIQAGARQVEVTINGIGERAGNTALEEIVMTLQVRKPFLNFTTNVRTEYLYPTSRLLSSMIGFPIARNKAIVGENAFAHEAGIHQDGMLKNRETYEIMTPQNVGRTSSKIVLGRHSGKHGFKHKVNELNIHLDDEQLESAFQAFLKLADKKKEIYEEDLYSILSNQLDDKFAVYKLINFSIESASGTDAQAKVEIQRKDVILEGKGKGDGPIDAIFRAIERAIDVETRLLEYNVQAITPGKQAQGEVSLLLSINGKRSLGRGSSTDILEASALAFTNAIVHNQLLKETYHP